MAVTLTNIRQGVSASGKRTVAADVAFPNPYTVGGELPTLAQIGLSRVEFIDLSYAITPDGTTTSTTTHGRQVVPDVTNVYAPKLKLYVSNNTESGAIDQTQVVQRVVFVGR